MGRQVLLERSRNSRKFIMENEEWPDVTIANVFAKRFPNSWLVLGEGSK